MAVINNITNFLPSLFGNFVKWILFWRLRKTDIVLEKKSNRKD